MQSQGNYTIRTQTNVAIQTAVSDTVQSSDQHRPMMTNVKSDDPHEKIIHVPKSPNQLRQKPKKHHQNVPITAQTDVMTA
jgi:hypothetical protein